MAPASAVTYTLGAALPYAGAALPLAVLITLIVSVLIALSIGALARHFPSAGGFFTYLSRALGVHVGWLAGWLFDLAYLCVVPFQLLVLGPVAESFTSTYLNFSLGPNGWAIWAAIFAVLIFALTYFGIKISADVGIVLGCIEIGIFVVLAAWLIITAGSANTLAAFDPARGVQQGLAGWQGILLGMVFVVLGFAGYESAAPLAEETQRPRSTVPQAIVLAALGIGIFYVFCSYAGVVGWGIDKIASYKSDVGAWTTLANRVWGPFSFLVALAILNSALANSNAGVNAVTRVLYAMGRVRALPTALAHLNRFRVPDLAIILTMVLAVVLALVPGFIYGPETAFALVGTTIALPIIFIYLATCVAVPIYYLRQRRTEFNVFFHLIVPIIPALTLLAVLYFQVQQMLAPPLNIILYVVAGWLVLGLVIVVLLALRAPAVLERGNRVYLEEKEVTAS
jgi:amino acid transporter